MHQQARGCDLFEATLTGHQDIASSVAADKSLWTAALPACLSLGALGIHGQGSIRTPRDIAPCLLQPARLGRGVVRVVRVVIEEGMGWCA